MKIYIVVGVDAHHSDILGVYKDKEDAEKYELTEDQCDYAFVYIREWTVV